MTAALWHRLTSRFYGQLDEAIAAGLTEFHFDDGYDDIRKAGVALEERGLHGVFFIVPGWLNLPGQATGGDVRWLFDHGHEIGNHTMHHCMMTKIPAPVAIRHIEAAELELVRMTDARPKRIAWPYGKDPELPGFAGRGITAAEVKPFR